jgi:hypothetical protein
MKKSWKLTYIDAGEEQYRVPIKDEIKAVEYFEARGYDVGTDAYYKDPDRYVRIIVRKSPLPKLPNPLGLPDPLGITDHPDKTLKGGNDIDDYVEDIATRYEAGRYDEVIKLWREFSKSHRPEEMITLYQILKNERDITLDIVRLKKRIKRKNP